MESKLERDVRLLKAYAMLATLACAALVLTAFTWQGRKQKFGEIDVERINVVESDGRLRIVISNQERQHPGITNGKLIKRSGPRPPGLIFFNHLGDEMGGLLFGDNGGKGHFGSFTFDKVRNDQTIGFRHLEGDNGAYQTSLEMWQRPDDITGDVVDEKLEAANKIKDEAARKAAIQALADSGALGAQRLFLGKRRDNSAGLVLYDVKGKPRIRMNVAPDGAPRLDFLDETGKVFYSVPDENKTGRK